MTHKHISEEKVFDFIHKDVSNHDVMEIEQHINRCSQCRQLYEFWMSTLGEDVRIPEEAKEKTWQTVISNLQHKPVRKSFTFSIRKGLIVAFACTLFFITGIYIGESKTNDNALPEKSTDPVFVMDDTTLVYDLVHTNSGLNKGYAWYNPHQKEVVLYINDIYNDYSYIAELETKNNIINKHPIHLSNGSAQVYFKDEHLEDLYQIVLTNQMDRNDQNRYKFELIPNINVLWNDGHS
ncbi:hypothetical protein [Salirhabdus sp. Marseille-P4669]|uniref:hypothetical protein n=1 Tax=Salirhabdus sp. Marseille-P4669 TaxID=2042310 RepID=UPI000C7957FE|nr:hypothetical protein [Salirhabdus sp. Marseille-P4669]